MFFSCFLSYRLFSILQKLLFIEYVASMHKLYTHKHKLTKSEILLIQNLKKKYIADEMLWRRGRVPCHQKCVPSGAELVPGKICAVPLSPAHNVHSGTKDYSTYFQLHVYLQKEKSKYVHISFLTRLKYIREQGKREIEGILQIQCVFFHWVKSIC